MKFCLKCGTHLSQDEANGECDQCGTPTSQPTPSSQQTDGSSSTATSTTDLEDLPTTKSGNVKKADAIGWLAECDRPSSAELRSSVLEKPNDFTGSTFPTDISTIRLTGHPQFIETIAGLFTWIVDMEDYSRRVEINLQETDDKETGETRGNYALYLSVAERG